MDYKPSSLAIAHNGASIYVSYSDRSHIVQYDVSSGKKLKTIKVGKKAVSKILLHPQLDVIVACRSVNVHQQLLITPQLNYLPSLVAHRPLR